MYINKYEIRKAQWFCFYIPYWCTEWPYNIDTPFSICDLSIQKRGCQVWQGCPKDSAQLAQTGVWILASLGEYLRTHLKDHTRYNRGPEIHNDPRRVSLLFGEAHLAGCLRVQVGGPLEWEQASSDYAQCRWGECEHCHTRLVHSTQLLSRLEMRWLCEVF